MHYHNITHDDMLNGDGLRVVLWVAGCSHHCPECQNPITWDCKGGIEFDDAAKEELFTELDKSYISGITFSGGDPLYLGNREEVGNLIKEIKERYPNKTIWLYTGYTWEELQELEFLPLIDVLVDGRYMKDLRDIKLYWRGSSNQRVINVPKSLEKQEIVLLCE